MKLMFNKIDYSGRWFDDDEEDTNFTEKVPPDISHIFNEETNEWVLRPVEEEDSEGGIHQVNESI